MKTQTRRVLIALAFGVPTGALALMGLWIATSSAWGAWEARDWVPVNARVVNVETVVRRGSVYELDAFYRYTYKGRDYNGKRLSVMDEDIAAATWKDQMAARLEEARKRAQPVTVYVNDARPTDAVVDRAIRWRAFVVLGFEMLLMGSIAWVALAIAWFGITRPEGSPQWRAHEEAKARRKEAREAMRPVAPAAAKPKPRFVGDAPAYEFSPREAMPSMTVAIPPDIATVHDLGGKITIDYVGPTRTLYGDLRVIASASELRVQRTLAFGLFKRKDFIAPAADVSTMGAQHTNTDTMATPPVRYYKLYLWTSDARHLTIGRGLPGEEVTNALLLRIAKVLKFEYDKIWIARPPSP